MPRWLFALLALVPVALLGGLLGLPAWILFFAALGAVVPLASLIGMATDEAALAKGPKVGGILNATFGNVPDLLVGYYGVQAGLLGFVKSTLIGAIISNSAFIIGLAFVAAGISKGLVRFDAREAGHHTVLMLLAVAGLLLPSVAAATVHPAVPLEGLSIGFAVILLLAYLAYVVYSILGFSGGPRVEGERVGEQCLVIAAEAAVVEAEAPRWSLGVAALVLLGTSIVLAPVTDVLVASVTPAVRTLGWTQTFTGMILVANAGNAAEMYTAVRVGRLGRLDLALDVASGSSIQIATFVAPLVLLLSLAMHPMDLVFDPLELAILAVVVAIFAYVAHDGETNWLEGFQLLAIYAMAASVFYILPSR